MGRFQRAEAAGLIAFLACSMFAIAAMSMYMNTLPAIWQVTRRLFTAASSIVACSSVCTFIFGYIRALRNQPASNRIFRFAKNTFETIALATIYGATMFLMSFALLSIINSIIGRTALNNYLPVVCCSLSGVVGYATFVQAALLKAKTVACLLPLFVISGAATAGLTSDDPYWYHNNFSQLGDRTTFAASMFNATLILAGLCIMITSYFTVHELIATQREHTNTTHGVTTPQHFHIRMIAMATILILCGFAFIGIGTFRYTPHPVLHDLCARGVTGLVCGLLIGLPWFAPQLSRTLYIASDLAVALTGWSGQMWLHGHNTLTNVEALSCLLFLGWIIVFSRQVAAMESDRAESVILKASQQYLHSQSHTPSIEHS